MNLTTAQIEAPAHHGEHHGHASGHHDPHLAHHFDSTEQQFEADKLGMWVFLITEILFFSGLFCAYAVYRANHPEIFEYAHLFLNRTLGAVNTVVLLFSSLTMAWGVRCAQLSQPKGLKICLILTLLCAFGFLGIKYVEYKNKWEEGLLWGDRYHPTEEALAHIAHLQAEHSGHAGASHGAPITHEAPTGAVAAPNAHAASPVGAAPDAHATSPGGATATAGHEVAATPTPAGTTTPAAAPTPAGTTPPAASPNPAAAPVPAAVAASAEHAVAKAAGPVAPDHVSIFFAIYFCMTGLHGIHILVGIGLITWLLIRSYRGEFTDGYFTPVDLVGLYWHIVDLVWIYLFPLLYLIH